MSVLIFLLLFFLFAFIRLLFAMTLLEKHRIEFIFHRAFQYHSLLNIDGRGGVGREGERREDQVRQKLPSSLLIP